MINTPSLLNSYLYVLAPGAASPEINVVLLGRVPGEGKIAQVYDIGTPLRKSKAKFSTLF